MIDLEGLDLLAEIGGVSADVDHIANAQRLVQATGPFCSPYHFDLTTVFARANEAFSGTDDFDALAAPMPSTKSHPLANPQASL